MQQLNYEQVEVREELSYRILKNYARLEGIEYRPGRIFNMGKNWPGDWEGRTRLAWIMLARISGRKPAYLAAVNEMLEQNLNARHYFKKILPEGMADEQQVSGHNWFLRSLLEEYLYTGKEEAAERAKRLVENLYLPLKGMYEKYPYWPDDRNKNGRASGHIEGAAVNGWYLSTDIGCAFMPFDGLSQYFQLFHDERVGELLDEMTDAFRRIDPVACSMQTHAALSAARGMIRYYQCVARKELLTWVEELFDTYIKYGMTENYANYNWFGRPAWTEPCAIVDSYLLAVELFKETGEIQYVRISDRILYNALSHAQRENGGFGCDKCAGSAEAPDILTVYPECYEASWCCSMRGGEGLARAGAQAVLEDEAGYLFLNYVPMRYSSENISFSVSTEYPDQGRVDISVEKMSGEVLLRFYIPQSTKKGEVKIFINGTAEEGEWKNGLLCILLSESGMIRLRFPIAIHQEEPVKRSLRGKYTSLWYGDLMLGNRQRLGESSRCVLSGAVREQNEHGGIAFRMGECLLEPVGGSLYRTREELQTSQFQILFPKEEG